MIPKGLPVMFICKNGCAVCTRCKSPVPFGDSCQVCHPRQPFGMTDEEMNADDLPF
jgi:hypothetical protein